ncbi:GNAT family N-acetyltransferase [Actinomycetaceae bacterium MB13-C1-2]|nr:GNAT family N-acetyltransferase [Actinomycetaceae bacterium MB13-C1-2]
MGQTLPSPDREPLLQIRRAFLRDVEGLAAVMASRGGTADDHMGNALRSIEKLPIFLVAEVDGATIGWCGAQRVSIREGEDPEWLISGLAVVPGFRRIRIASKLMQSVIEAVSGSDSGSLIFSIVNANNAPSIALHKGLGFSEVSRGASFAGVEFDGGEGVLFVRN